MAIDSNKEEVIIEVKIETSSSIKELEKIDKAILNNKESLKDLNKAYKEGTITQDEFVEENIRIQQNIKKEVEQRKILNSVINANSNSIEGLKARNAELRNERNKLDLTTDNGIKKLQALNKQIEANDKQIQKNVSLMEQQKLNIGNYASALDLVIPGTGRLINTFTGLGTSIEGTTKAIQATGFSLQTLNTIPVVAVVSGIIGAYQILSSVLNKNTDDIEANKEKLKQDTEELRRNFEARKAFFSKETEAQNSALEQQIKLLEAEGNKEREVFLLKKQLNAERLKEANVVLRAAQDAFDQTGLQGPLVAARDNLREAKRLVNEITIEDKVLEAQEKKRLDEVSKKEKERLKVLKDFNDQAEAFVRQKDKEVADRFTDEGQDKDLQLLKDKEAAQIESERRTNEERLKLRRLLNHELSDEEKEQQKVQDAIFEHREKLYIEDAKKQKENTQKKIQADQALLAASASVLTSLSSLAQEGSAEQKELALAAIAADTASAIAGGVAASQDIPYPGNLEAMATSIAAILAAIAQAQQLGGFAGGGYTGSGYGQPDSSGFKPAGIVHEHEYVAPKWIVNSSAGQYHISQLESMRVRGYAGYATGGLVTASATKEVNNAFMTENIVKSTIENMPPIVASAVEFTKAQKKIKFKENINKI